MLELSFKICDALSLEYQHSIFSHPYPVTVFEHGLVGQTIKHAHLHYLPTVVDLTSRVRGDFPKAEIEELQYVTHIQDLYHERQEPYLFWTEPQGKSMVCWNPPAPPEYLRIVAAAALGRPERASWRKMDSELDRKLWSETVKKLKPYFA